jgi:hypothetical protein
MRRIRQTTGEKQTFLVEAKSYKIISGSVWDVMLCYALMKTELRRLCAIVEFQQVDL